MPATKSTMGRPTRDLRVGAWRVRPLLGSVEREGREERPEARSIAVLVALAEAGGRPLSRRSLLTRVWGDAFVGEEVLSHAIWDLRRALGDDARDPHYIQTLPKRGYRLLAPVEWLQEGADGAVPAGEEPARGAPGIALRGAPPATTPGRRALHATSWLALPLLLFVAWWLRPVETPRGSRAVGIAAPPDEGFAFVPTADAGASSRVREPQLTRLTSSPGEELYPSLSPNGEIVVFAAREGEDWDVFLRPVAGGRALNLTATSPADDLQPALSPDGRWIAFRSERDGGGLYVVDLGGETPRRLVGRGWDPAWSPDGRRLAFATESAPSPLLRYRSSELWLIEIATGETRRIPVRDAVRPAWSPHGWRLAFWSNDQGRRDIYTVAPEGGSPVTVTDDDAVDWDPVWSAEGDQLYFASDRGGGVGLWRVAIEEASGVVRGPPEQVVMGLGPTLAHLRISCGGRCLVFTGLETRSWVEIVPWAPDGRVGEPTAVTAGLIRVAMPAVSPGGNRIAFKLGEVGDIAVIDRDGTRLRRLTDNPYREVWPRFSPDGGRVAYASNQSGSLEIWTVEAAGGAPRRLTDLPGETLNAPVWSPDGRAMVATSVSANRAYLFDPRVGHRDQTLDPLSPAGADDLFVPWSWSPDGDRLAGFLIPAGAWPRASHDLAVYSLSRGRLARLPAKGTDPCWLSDGRHLLYYDRDRGELAKLDTVTGAISPVLRRPAGSLGVGYWLPSDDRSIVFVSTISEADLWMLSLGEGDGAGLRVAPDGGPRAPARSIPTWSGR